MLRAPLALAIALGFGVPLATCGEPQQLQQELPGNEECAADGCGDGDTVSALGLRVHQLRDSRGWSQKKAGGESLRSERSCPAPPPQVPWWVGPQTGTGSGTGAAPLRVAFVGNSYTFYNDLPQLVQKFLQRGLSSHGGGGASGCSSRGESCRQSQCCSDPTLTCFEKDAGWAACRPACTPGIHAHDPIEYRTPWSCNVLKPPPEVQLGACLAPNSNLKKTWDEGGEVQGEAQEEIGCRALFASVQELLASDRSWDVVVLQEQSRGPASEDTLQRALRILRGGYIPLLKNRAKLPLVVFYQNAGYRGEKWNPASEAPRNFVDLTARLEEGYHSMAGAVDAEGLDVTIAFAGRATKKIYDADRGLWRKMYQWDNFHPSALGSLVNAATVADAIASHPRFHGRFPGGLTVDPSYPPDVQTFGDVPPPSDDVARAAFAAAGLPMHWR